jgi:preprotein translocase subunit SecD
MKFKPKSKFVLILILLAVFGYVSLPRETNINLKRIGVDFEKKFERKDININFGGIVFKKNLDLKLGLDLAGGSHLVFEADTTNIGEDRKKQAIDGLRNIVERRVNLFGISEPNIQTSYFEGKDRIIVELPGIKDAQEAVDLIGKTAQLVFAEVGTEEDPGLYPTDLTGADLKTATVSFDQTTGKPIVGLEFTQEGAVKFEELTSRNIGKPVPILVDEEIVSAPVVQGTIAGGTAQITGDFTLEEVRNLVVQLNSGALPLTISLVEQRTVGATLGSESIDKSMRAGLVGLMMVSIFMILVYGKLGLVAIFSLGIFGVLTLGMYKLIPVVLTLPGIAGFLLSVGMAVDSNILIFERFKEEKLKRNLEDAFETSFGRAWDSIRDANVATLFTTFVLANPLDWNFLQSSGPVRGFAITLALGIIISLFTGVVISRNVIRVFFYNDATKEGNSLEKKIRDFVKSVMKLRNKNE